MKNSILTFSTLLLAGSGLGNYQDGKSTENSLEISDRPNIIFLLTDDLRWDALGFMGNEYVITPHIDRLADQSISFSNAYHVSPICLPSRASIMTGEYLGMHGSGFDRPTKYVITEEEFSTSYPGLLQKSGYYNGFIGKFGFAVYGDSKKAENKDYYNREEGMPKHYFDIWNGFAGQGAYRQRNSGTFNGYENNWNATHLTEFMGYQAIEFIQKANRENQPFSLSVSFKAPHAPFDPAEHFRRLYDNMNIPRMSNDDPMSFANLPEVVQEKSRNSKRYHGKIHHPSWHIGVDSTYQEFIKNYYALITGVDDVVGQIRHKLNELGIADNTVIIFTSDNGFFNGSRQLHGKALLYDESAKAPMIVYDPRYMKDEKGREEKGLISIIDMAPTILDLAGIEKPENMPGKSIMPIVYNEVEDIHDAVYGENNFDLFQPVIYEVDNPEEYQSIRSKFVRTKNFKYIRYHECQPVVEELFKMTEDPGESLNLVNDTDYEDEVQYMRGLLDAFEEKFVRDTNSQEDTEKPNVILILTDDQGYGDIASHGHPHVITPNMDRLRDMSVRLENFHVDPTCAPTRASLMTGRYSARVGVWHTIIGRNLLREDEVTLAEVFRDAGYRTGIFGKWHLGDSYPYAARFRGFDEAIVHGAGGVGQTPDYWGNDYFEDHYNDNGAWRPFQGYCTDVWFNEALRFIRESKEQPFFLYLPTNAAHQTRSHVSERYKDLYKDISTTDRLRIFWGMITNIDDNLGVMMDRLEHWGLLDNTILIFMGDNGSCMGRNSFPENERAEWSDRYNSGMQGNKSSHYDGGHRVFGYVYYPAAGIEGGRDIDHITAHIDLMPTLMELCNIPKPAHVEFDGASLVPLLSGTYKDWPERTLFVHNQRVLDPIKWRQTSVMTDRWRLMDNTNLYDIKQDPGQHNNIIEYHPEVAEKLRSEYDLWWNDISQRFHETTPLYIGAEQQNPVQLNAHDWMVTGLPPWNQPHIITRQNNKNGPWVVRVTDAGRYAFILRERPEVAGFPLSATSARLYIEDMVDEIKPVVQGATAVRFEVELEAGDMEVKTWLMEKDETSRGAYFVEVERLSNK